MRARTPARMPTWLKIALCLLAVLGLAWGTLRSLARSAPIAAEWSPAHWFVGVSLVLMAVAVATTVVCVVRGPPEAR